MNIQLRLHCCLENKNQFIRINYYSTPVCSGSSMSPTSFGKWDPFSTGDIDLFNKKSREFPFKRIIKYARSLFLLLSSSLAPSTAP